jgi:uncharacterized membrane-anchored protein
VKKSSLTRGLVVVATLAVLGVVNGTIVAKERIKTQGERIYLALAPVDPRSLMQGDYLALRFTLAEQLSTEASGLAQLEVDSRGVATLGRADQPGSLQIRYRVRNERVWLGTNAYFFEEGGLERYAHAAFGEFRVDRASGEAVLTGLRDKDLAPLGATPH